MKAKLRKVLPPLLTLIVFSLLIVVWSQPQLASSTDPPQTIESDSALVTQSGTWTTQTTSNASGGSYLYSSGSADDTLSLEFYGTRIDVVYVAHPSFGSFTVEIDNNEIRTVTAESKATLFDQRAVFDYLDAGPHTLRIMGIQGVVGIDGFITSQSQIGMPTATPPPYYGVPTGSETTPSPTVAESLGASSSESQSLVISACDVEKFVSNVNDLRLAVTAANDDPDVDTTHCIFLEAGTYNLVVGGQDGTLLIDHNINFYGLDYPENVILDGMDQERIMDIQSGQVEIHHLHLTNGVHHSTTIPATTEYGGAIHMTNGEVFVTDSIFSSNGDINVTEGGGAILGRGTFIRTQFIDNEAGGGGAIQYAGSSLEITNSCFHNNKATYGGAILNTQNGAGVDISESSFVENVFTDYTNGGGGAIFNLSSTYTVEAVDNYWASWNTSMPPIEGPAHSPIRDVPPADPNDPSTYTDTINGDINLDSDDVDSNDNILTTKPSCEPTDPYLLPNNPRVLTAVEGVFGTLIPNHPLTMAVNSGVNLTANALHNEFTQLNTESPSAMQDFDRVMFNQQNTQIMFVFYNHSTISQPDSSNLTEPIKPDTNDLRLPITLSQTTNINYPGTTPNYPNLDRHSYDLVCPYMAHWPTGTTINSGFNHSDIHDQIEQTIFNSGHNGLLVETLILCDLDRAVQQYSVRIGDFLPQGPQQQPSTQPTQISWFSPATAVFNFGQIFILRTDGTQQGITTSFFNNIERPGPAGVLFDLNNDAVMGFRQNSRQCLGQGHIFVSEYNSYACPSTPTNVDDWERGMRGWGSPMTNGVINGDRPICFFQQDPLSAYDDIYSSDPWRVAEVRAAAADMFLNWVYGFPNAWWNIDWKFHWDYVLTGNTHNCVGFVTNPFIDDSIYRLPGEARRIWIRDLMDNVIFPTYFP